MSKCKCGVKCMGGARDDLLSGEPCCNISDKNKSFCELTAVYWAWKNIKALYPSLEYIGVNHYRRYFSFERAAFLSTYTNKPDAAVRQYGLNLGKLEKMLSAADAVLAKPPALPYLSRLYLRGCVSARDVDALKRIAHNKYPAYDRAMRNVLIKGRKVSHFNICIMRWDNFDAYCEWLFDILFELERQIDISGYSTEQKRVFGYMSERLLPVWTMHNGLKVRCLPIALFNDATANNSIVRRVTRLAKRVFR